MTSQTYLTHGKFCLKITLYRSCMFYLSNLWSGVSQKKNLNLVSPLVMVYMIRKMYPFVQCFNIRHSTFQLQTHPWNIRDSFGIHIDKLGVKRLVVLLTIPIMASWHNGNLVYTCEPLALTEKQHLKGVWKAAIPQFNSATQSFIWPYLPVVSI